MTVIGKKCVSVRLEINLYNISLHYQVNQYGWQVTVGTARQATVHATALIH